MGRTLSLFLITWCLTSLQAHAQGGGVQGQPCSMTAPLAQFHREHQIPTTDEYHVPVVTPGGMVLQVPKMILAVDVLTIIWRSESELCFGLVAVGQDRNECHVQGVARIGSDGTFGFRDDEVALRLTLLSPDQIRVERTEKAPRKACESLRDLEPATYTRTSVASSP